MVSQLPRQAAADAPRPYYTLPTIVNHSMTIRIAIMGMPDVDTKLLTWNLEQVIEPYVLVTSNPQNMGGYITYGSRFSMNYQIFRVAPSITTSLEQYLQSIGQEKKVPDSLHDSSYYWYSCYYDTSISCYDSGKYSVFNSTLTEQWINSHISDFGGIPDDGYTIIVADLSSAFKEYHYYESTFNDSDTASVKATYHKQAWPIVDWSFSLGGNHRFYYVDLSGGDPFYDYSGVGHIPVQNFNVRYYKEEKVDNKRTPQSITSYVADYVAEATRNLFLPSYLYAPTFATSYKIAITVFDQTGKISQDNIGEYLSVSGIKSAFQTLVPYASWDVSLRTRSLSDDPDLRTVLMNNSMFSREVDGKYGSQTYHGEYYDDRAVYSYLQTHSSEYCPDDKGAIILPVYIFVFNGSSTFAITSEEAAQRSIRNPIRSFAGETQGDLVLISMNSAELFDYGYGLTQTAIHELGHMMGLMHPHQYGETESFVSSPMSYSAYVYTFSQFDVDAVQRAHADYLLSNIQNAMSPVSSATLQSEDARSALAKANETYQSAIADYNSKNYARAITSLHGLQELLDQVFNLEASTIQDTVQNATVSSGTARGFLNNASSELSAAQRQKAEGNLGLAYELLNEASTSVRNARQAETQAQADAQANQNAYNTALTLGISVGVTLGLAMGIGIGLILRRRRHKALKE